MHARLEGFANQDLSILISATAEQASADKEAGNSGDSVSLSL